MFESLLNRAFTATRPTLTSDGQGGFTPGTQNLGSIQGRIRSASSAERTTAQSEGREVSHVFYCAAGTDLQRGDQLTSGELVVTVTWVRTLSVQHHMEAECFQIQKRD